MGRLKDLFNTVSTGFTLGMSTAFHHYAESLPADSRLRKVMQAFQTALPDNGGTATTIDEALVIKTSPYLFEYQMFQIEWDRRAEIRDIELMLKMDPRAKKANRIFANTAVRGGVTITVTSNISERLATQAQEIIDEMMRNCQVNSKLTSWARILLKEGDLFINPIIDIEQRKIKNLKRLPGITMQRCDDMTGNFPNVEAAFRQIDPISLLVLSDFPLWAINHVRWSHEEGERYGESQYRACRNYWKKLNMTEEDLVVRRRTRAVPRRLHIIGNKDHPGDWKDVKKYKEENKLTANNPNIITTDYFTNGLGDIKDLNPDAKLNEIDDVQYLEEKYMVGLGPPPALLGYGRDVNRDILEDQVRQFKEDAQELRDLLEYGDSSAFSGLRFLCDFALALQGVNPLMVEYSFRWKQNDNETADAVVERVVSLRDAKRLSKPLITRKLGVQMISRFVGLENQKAIDAELEALEEEDELNKDEIDEPIDPGANDPDDDETTGESTAPAKESMIDAATGNESFFHFTGGKQVNSKK